MRVCLSKEGLNLIKELHTDEISKHNSAKNKFDSVPRLNFMKSRASFKIHTNLDNDLDVLSMSLDQEGKQEIQSQINKIKMLKQVIHTEPSP